MGYPKTKIYTDSSHYIGIPEIRRPKAKRPKPKGKAQTTNADKVEFDEQYRKYSKLRYAEKKKKLEEAFLQKFQDEQLTKGFVEKNMERANRNRMQRKKRFERKVKLQQWNYFLTFTYSDEKLNEDDFRKKLMNSLRHLASRRKWKYAGVWERSPKNNRLHFHCLAYIPDGQMIGEIVLVKDYDTVSRRMQETYQNSHFLEHYGRNDFKKIGHKLMLPKIIDYIGKYIEKSGEKIVYSRGLATYFVSDILDDDVLCAYKEDDIRFILADNFLCIDEGEIMGEVSPEVIEKMPKAN